MGKSEKVVRILTGVPLATVAPARAVAPGVASGQANRSPIRVSLTARNHDPRPSDSPAWQWAYCVTVTTAAGTSVASTIQLQILSGTTILKRFAWISLRKGYNHWCAAIGGEANVLEGVPRGRELVLQAVVRADGVTVKPNWPIVVR